MSLFDVIRYSNTDLDSLEELSDLPVDLFEAYQYAAYAHFGNSRVLETIREDSMRQQVGYLACTWSGDTDHSKYDIFKKVLEKYEPI